MYLYVRDAEEREREGITFIASVKRCNSYTLNSVCVAVAFNFCAYTNKVNPCILAK